ncbi:MAG: methyltransferase domain-containing protein [Acidobacteriota bacterium]
MKRLLTGDGIRKTRFHDYCGNRIDLKGIVYLPHAVATTLIFKLFGYRPALPWLGFRGIRALDALIQPDWRVLEFGCGTSTVWLAKRAREVVSIEHDPSWFDVVSERLQRSNLTSVDIRLQGGDDYERIPEPESSFDLALVDGLFRSRASEVAVRTVRTGGWIYLDNCDVQDADHKGARAILLNAADHVRFFTDFYPTYVGVNQGMLVRVK